MLQVVDIKKDYILKDQQVNALKGVNITFRRNEFVSILGPSGCGKTTLLNIIGGLDRYTSGDLIINGVSTKNYKDRDWDTYRNHSIGFVFQSYNLIPHQTALKNVELALSIGGISRKERRQKAIEALKQVGLEEQINKKPNQMSGGQCQRVAIARAIVNNPDIILADEPTGALDSKTSVQIMDLLKELAKDRLIIMVTHNGELANTYSTRIITMKDGEVLNDTNPVSKKEINAELKIIEKEKQALTQKEQKQKQKKFSMSLWSSFMLSGSNLLTKKRRTFITSLACSIGIIGIAVILSVSTGMHAYVKQVEKDSMSVNYISISATTMNMETNVLDKVTLPEYPNSKEIYPYNQDLLKQNKLTNEFVNYLEDNVNGDTEETDLVSGLTYSRNISLFNTGMPIMYAGELTNNPELLATEYTAIATHNGKAIPAEKNELTLIVDKYNRISELTLQQLGITYTSGQSINYADIVGKNVTLTCGSSVSLATEYNFTIISVLRQNKDSSIKWVQTGGANMAMSMFPSEIAFTKALADEVEQTNPDAVNIQSLMIYPKDFDSKDQILEVLETWNNSEIYKIYGNNKDAEGKYEADQYKVSYTDISELLVGMLGNLIDISTYTLVAFSAVSLVVSSIMIAIITYASVIERIKEIGTIRSLGGRKKDVANIFRVEACIIGGVSALIALITTLIINGLINLVLGNLVGVTTIATLSWSTTLWMVILSVGLNLLASLIPANIAAKKDPVLALRSE